MTSETGASLPEVLTIIALMAIALGAAFMYLTPASAPLQAGTVLVEGTFRQARLRAIATTSAYRVVPDGDDFLRTETSGNCSDTTWTEVDGAGVELPDGVSMSDTTWIVCFTSRGISTDNLTITLSHADYGTSQVEVLIGGTTRVL